MKHLSPDDPNEARLYWLLQVVALEVDIELEKRELQENGERGGVGLIIPKRKRSKRERPPIPPPKLDTESEPVSQIPPPKLDTGSEPVSAIPPPKLDTGSEPVSPIPPPTLDTESEPVSPIPPPTLDTESEQLNPKRKQRRPLGAILPPGLSINFTPHEKKLKKRKLEDGEWEEVKPKAKRIKKQKPHCPNPPPDLPDNMRRHIVETMGGTGLVLVIQKPLFFSDVNRSASRFSIPFSQISTHDFLNEAEVKALDDKNKKNSNDLMQVTLLDPSMRQTTHTFNKWVMNNTSLYVMTKPWNDVVNKNGLEENDIVQLWSFRVDSKLCFTLVKLQVQPVN